ncbi:MAG: HAMP domain-containing histidine kinase [Myxococcales bacterium]|nr:HAMP domain-containing histidine kinase [Myxococcales bacterium]
MLRRLLPTLLALALGLAALLLGLAGLGRIFRAERDEATAELSARRRALEQYALEALKQQLSARLSSAAPAIDRALADPLAPDQGLFFQEQSQQLLPRRLLPAPSMGEGQGRALHRDLANGAALAGEAGEPWGQRLLLLSRFEAALRKADRREIEESFRAILFHRAMYRVGPAKEVPFTLHLLEQLLSKSSPEPSLLRALLRDGLGGPRGAELEGLQRALIRRKDRFTAEELSYFCERIASLSARAGAAFDDFSARCQEEPAEELGVPSPLGGPSLHRGRWYVEPTSQGARGVEVSLEELLAGILAEMRERALLGAEERLPLPPAAQATRAVSSLAVAVESPSFGKAQRSIEARYRVKTALLLGCGLLATVLAAMAVVLQHRRHRFLELKADFISTVSHELRTPLASVRVMAETLEKRLLGHAGARDYPARIVREVDSLGFLVENILSFNRLDKGRWVARLQLVRLDELLPPLAEEAKGYSQAQVTVALEGMEGISLTADRELLSMLFRNLLRNACRHNANERVEVAISAERRERELLIGVRDNGVGIPEGERENVFKEFHRLRTAGKGGSGLGLAICKRIMGVHRGGIRVQKSGPEGTTFELCFPRRGEA